MEIASLAQRLREVAIQADNAAVQSTSDICTKCRGCSYYGCYGLIQSTTKFNGKALMATSDTTISDWYY